MSQGNKHSSNWMKRGENLGSFPTDLIVEIFLRLPAKSVARLRSLSKLWGSMLNCPYFTELFLTRSSARPRFLLAVEQDGVRRFYSAPQPHNSYDKSSLVVTADLHTKFSKDLSRYDISYASGLIYFSNIGFSKDSMPVVCNPSTGQCARLPELRMDTSLDSFLGFDPIDKQFKVLLLAYSSRTNGTDCRILTLGTGDMMWRKIESTLVQNPYSQRICINGVLYYLAETHGLSDNYLQRKIVCFDVRSEKFKFIGAECFDSWTKLINYKGKIGVVSWKYNKTYGLRMWVLEDVEKQEWSKYVYTFPENDIVHPCSVSIVGMTATGEFVLSARTTFKPYYVFYFNPERKALQTVEIQGFAENGGKVYAFVDHVEDLHLIK